MGSTAQAARTGALITTDDNGKAKMPTLVDVERTLPIERPEQIGATLAGISAALVGAVDGADDISLEIDASPTGIRYRFRSYRRSAR